MCVGLGYASEVAFHRVMGDTVFIHICKDCFQVDSNPINQLAASWKSKANPWIHHLQHLYAHSIAIGIMHYAHNTAGLK